MPSNTTMATILPRVYLTIDRMRNRLFQHTFGIWIILLPLLTVLPSGCHFTALHGKPVLSKPQAQVNPPRSIAILPTVDDTGHPGLDLVVRRELFSAITPLAYEDRELIDIDQFLANKAARLGRRPEQLTHDEMADPKLADCVFYSRITRITRVYLLLYAHFRFDMDMELVDTRTHQTLYRNHAVYYDRLGNPSYVTLPILGVYAFVDVAGNSVKALWHLRSGRIAEIFRDAALEIAKTIPQPEFIALSRGGTVRLTTVQVVRPFPILSVGNRVIVKAQGTPGMHATFNIPQITQDVPMSESTPGSYLGFYDICPGDNSKFAVVELRLSAAQGDEAVHYTVIDQSFAVDTTTAPRARIAEARSRFMRRGVFLKYELDPAAAAQTKDKKLVYQLFRRIGGKGNFVKIATDKISAFHDTGVHKGDAVEYYVLTRDEAGNTSQLWEIKKLAVG